MKSKTIAVTAEEGGLWIPFNIERHRLPRTVHAIQFDDGSVWDAYNGWRGENDFTG